ncbi:hypothetical protein SAMN04515671_2635 [Nakamurella panacisegetis]|uniref:Uncharacterized protein n=1 Tax=Nakamurella panacisegetis TaxID=1090615 RepID=A0A1H0P5J9_9ACTN|nr:hypothetical protein SAMN04515671_2635 [Nakamurella panacisegetis]
MLQRAGRSLPVGLAALLLVGALLIGAGGLIGVATPFDHSALGSASGAVWIVLLPAVLALSVSAVRPEIGLAVTCGAGIVALARTVSDLGLLTSPNTAIRPEFFYELTDRAQPFSAGPGAAVVVVGDVVMVVAGVLAARRVAASLSFRTERIFDVHLIEVDDTGSGAELLVEALEESDAVRADEPESMIDGGPRRNNWLILAGFLGTLAVLAASLGLPYTGGYLLARYIPPEIGMLGLGAALVLALVAAVAVLTAAVLPRAVALGLLGGVAVGASIPFLTAVLVSITDAPVKLNPIVALGILGVVVLAASGALSRVVLVQDDYSEPSRASVRWLNLSGAVLSLAVAGAAVGGWRLPQLRYSGGAVPTTSGTGVALSAPQSAPYLVAAIIPAIAGVLWLVPIAARSGRALAAIGWVALVVAVAQSTYVLSELIASASVFVANSPFAVPRWSAGPGLWWGVAGIGLGLATCAIAALASRQAADASPLVAEEASLSRARSIGTVVAVVLTVVVVVVLSMPVYSTQQLDSATLLDGYQANSWGVLTLAAAMIAAAWAAGRSQRTAGAVSYALAGGAVLAVRLVIPAAVRAQDGFTAGPGLIGGYITIAAFAAAAVVLGFSAARIRHTDPVASKPVRPASGRRPVGGRSAAVRPAGPSGKTAAGASSKGEKKGRRR